MNHNFMKWEGVLKIPGAASELHRSWWERHKLLNWKVEGVATSLQFKFRSPTSGPPQISALTVYELVQISATECSEATFSLRNRIKSLDHI